MNKKEKSKIDISIVVGKGNKEFILPCLQSIYENYSKTAEVFVISNLASQDTIKEIKNRFPRVYLKMNKEKKGFAENHNNIIEITEKKYILILNDDTIVLKNAIDKIVDYMDKHPKVAVISPKLLNPDLSLQQSTYSFPSLFTIFLKFFGIRRLIPFNKFTYKIASCFYKKGKSRFWSHDKTCQVDTLRGACVLVRRKAVEEVGLMDEVSLAYGDETEWHYRFKKKGWKVVFYSKASIIHYGEQTTKKQHLHIKEEEIKGLLNFYRKHKNIVSYCFLRGIIIFIFSFLSLFSLMTSKKKISESYLKIVKISFCFNKILKEKRIFY